MSDVHLLAARRSPVVPRGGAFGALSLHALAAPVLQAAINDAGLSPEDVGEVIVANSLGPGGNPARVIALAAGLPETIAGLTIDRQCAGGLDALILGASLIRSGLHDIVVTGGAESYSRRPLRLQTFPDGRAPEPYDQAPFTPWPERDPEMAPAADALARKEGITRKEQDAWAMESHEKALAAQPTDREILPLNDVARDPFARTLTDRLCARAPVVTGSITSANMAVAADGAGFVVLASDRIGRNAPTLIGGTTLGGSPDLPGLAPVAAIRKTLKDADHAPEDLQVAEIMEAFAVQAIACERGAGIPHDIVNRKGGALARGHPIGASGAVLAVRLYHELVETGGIGLATIASAGGLGTAVLLKA